MKLVEARKAKGLEQTELVQISNVSLRSIGEIENGWKQPPFLTYVMARNLCKALQVGVSEIEEFQGVERPGDPCSCPAGCGGVKIPPKRPNGAKPHDLMLVPQMWRRSDTPTEKVESPRYPLY